MSDLQIAHVMIRRFKGFRYYALVTGAASGMGRIYSRELALKGYNVVLVDINAKGLAETEKIVREAVAASEKVPAELKGKLKKIPTIIAAMRNSHFTISPRREPTRLADSWNCSLFR